MNAQDAEEYTQSLSLTVAGSWRFIALAKRLGVPRALNLSVDEWVKDKLGGHVKRSITERREAALELKADGLSNVAIAEVLGVREGTIRNDLASQNCEAGDKKDKENNEAENEASQNCEPAPGPVDAMAALAAVEGKEYTKAKFSGETEWFTPAEYLDLAREVLGEIDLDPASCYQAQQTVKAKAYFTKADDGLSKEWHGAIWLNPPYAQPHIAQFMQKMVAEYKGGRVAQAIMLTHNSSDTTWFQLGAEHCSAICFTRGRINFVDKNGNTGSPSQGQTFFYFGNLPLQFKAVFETVGFVKT
jgi:phage N-6-adenine-methyltransferase